MAYNLILVQQPKEKKDVEFNKHASNISERGFSKGTEVVFFRKLAFYVSKNQLYMPVTLFILYVIMKFYYAVEMLPTNYFGYLFSVCKIL